MIGAATLTAVLIVLWWTGRPDGLTHLVVPELAGDGMLIRAPGGEIALVDGGSDGASAAAWLGAELPLAQERIDLLVLTRADSTTLPGLLAAVRRYRIGTAMLVQPPRISAAWDELVQLLHAGNAVVRIARAGDTALLGRNGQVRLRFLEVAAGQGLVEATYSRHRILLLQSLGSRALPTLPDGPRVDAVVYPWRRSPVDLAARGLRPKVVIFGEASGSDPQRSLAERRIGSARLLHEAIDGRIDVAFDATGLQVTAGRGRRD